MLPRRFVPKSQDNIVYILGYSSRFTQIRKLPISLNYSKLYKAKEKLFVNPAVRINSSYINHLLIVIDFEKNS